MKKILYFVFLSIFCTASNTILSQDSSSASLNTLAAPTSAGSVLLGVNPTDIQKPSDLNGIMMAVRNATNDFAQFPTSFAIDIAPWWLFGAKHISYNDFIGSKKTIAQTFNFSYAQSSQNDSNYNGLKQGIGISFSLLRGAIKDKIFLGRVESIKSILNELRDANHKMLDSLKLHDSVYTLYTNNYNQILQQYLPIRDKSDSISMHLKDSLIKKLIEYESYREGRESVLQSETKIAIDNLKTKQVDLLKKLEETITPVRKGFFINVSGGTIVKYDNFKVNAGSLTNQAAWANFGFDGSKTDTSGKSFISILALSRIIFNNGDELYKSGNAKKYTTWDNGLKLVFTTADQKFSLSGEAISRKLWKIEEGKSFTYKYLFNIDWAVGKNQRLTFSYGKDFENHISKDGNVIGYINFVKGIFDKKPIAKSSKA